MSLRKGFVMRQPNGRVRLNTFRDGSIYALHAGARDLRKKGQGIPSALKMQFDRGDRAVPATLILDDDD